MIRPLRCACATLAACCAILCGILAGCAREGGPGGPAFLDTSGIPISAELQAAIDATRRAPEASDPAGAQDLAAYERLAVEIQRPASRTAAGDSLYARWRGQPTHFLWIELAATYNYLLRRNADRNALYALPALADTGTSVGAFVQGRRYYRYGSRGEQYRRAGTMADQLDALQQAWLSLKLAMVDADTGQPLAAVRRLLAGLPAARAAGGDRLAGMYWRDAGAYLLRADRLDDALHAASIAGGLAVKCNADERATAVRMLIADIRTARSEGGAALELYDRCLQEASDHQFPWLVTEGLGRAAALSGTLGDTRRALAYDQRSVEHSIAMGDSLNAPRNMMNVAHDLRLTGALDSCLVWQRRARVWVEAFHDARNLAHLPLLEAEYWCHVGDYRTADSLLSVARARLGGAGLGVDEAELLLAQIRQGLETGQPEPAYRAIARLRELRASLYDRLPDRNLVADYEIATADFLTGQGELVRAHEALARAAAALAAHGAEGRRWEYERSCGTLARLREDPIETRRAFTACLDLAQQAEDPQRVVTSRFLLGRSMLDDGDCAQARALFEVPVDASFGGSFRTRLSALIFQGMALRQEGRSGDALVPLRRAAALCNRDTPTDLLVRLWLETGRALLGSGDARSAESSLLQARDLLAASERAHHLAELEAFTDDARRDLAEAMATLYCDVPGLLAAGQVGLQTLLLVGALCDPDTLADAGGASTAPGRPPDAPAGPALAHLVGRDRSFQWVITPTAITVRPLPGRAQLRSLVVPVMADMQQAGRPVDASAAATLGQLLLGSVAEEWKPGQTLTLLVDDLLASVPWGALPLPNIAGTPPTALALERGPLREVVHWAALRSPTPPVAPRTADAWGARGTLLAIGNDAGLSPDQAGSTAPRLRHAEAEARRVAAAWPGGASTLRTGASPADASDDNPTADWGRFSVIHVASHALVNRGVAARSTLRLAGAQAPVPVTLSMVAASSLRAQLVYLSCCEAAGRLAGGGVTDFARAFVHAGARAVIASTIAVDDEAASDLAERFYRHWLSGQSQAAALQQAQLETRAARPEWAHPAYWAFYRLLGDGD